MIFHAFLALAAGFALIVALEMAFPALVARLAPDWADEAGRLEPGSVFVSLGYSFLAAAAGGCITAWFAAANPLIHALALALAVLALSALNALQAKGKQPAWFQLAQVAISPIGVLAGGLAQLRVQGIL